MFIFPIFIQNRKQLQSDHFENLRCMALKLLQFALQFLISLFRLKTKKNSRQWSWEPKMFTLVWNKPIIPPIDPFETS